MFTVVGYRSFVSKKNGIRYCELFLVSDDPYVTGQRCDAVFVQQDKISGFENLGIGCSCNVFYNRFGRPDSITLI